MAARKLNLIQIFAIGLLALPTVANAGQNDATWDPPARYQGTYTGNLDLQYLPQPQVVTECRRLFAKYGLKDTMTLRGKGCAVKTGPKSHVIVLIDRPYLGSNPDDVLVHEIGHVLGWSADHPQ